MSNGNGVDSSTNPSSPTASGWPGCGELKMTSTPPVVAPAAADTATNVSGGSLLDSPAPLWNSSGPGSVGTGGVENPPCRIVLTNTAYWAPGVNPVNR